MNAFDGNLRARLSGFLDLEVFQLEQPPPGLLDTDQHFLANPRLSLFLDAQIGTHVYFFTQARADRGFDPADQDVQVRLDEYALRINPWEADRFALQIGKFATVVGNFVQRHLSWENPFVTAPLPYENLTTVWDNIAPFPDFFAGIPFDIDNNIPLIWGPSYASGGSVAGKIGKFNYAVEIKNSALASRPESWDATQIGFEHPILAAGLGSSLTRRGISASLRATVPIFVRKPNRPCRSDGPSAIIINFSWARTSASPGIICNLGRILPGPL